MKLAIQITEPTDYSKKALAVYRSLGRVVFDSKPRRDTEVLIIGLKYRIDKKWLDKMPNLRVIGWQGTGLNHIDIAVLKERGIKLISLRGRKGFLKNIPSTAEETIGLILALVRNIPWAFDAVKNGSWSRMPWRGRQLYQKTIGLIGFGRLGRIVARYARAFGMKTISYDPYVSGGLMKKFGVKKAGLDALLKNSDIVSLQAALTAQNHNLLKERHFRLMKPTAVLANTARGELIEKGILEKALKNKWIAGAAVDVMWDERSNGSHLKNNPLLEYAKRNKNLIIVPHIGGATYEAMAVTQDFIAELVKRYFKK